MTECVILFRNPNGGDVGFVSSEDQCGIAVFPNRDEANRLMEGSMLKEWPYQIVEIDEL